MWNFGLRDLYLWDLDGLLALPQEDFPEQSWYAW